jgi:hypothetical protein
MQGPVEVGALRGPSLGGSEMNHAGSFIDGALATGRLIVILIGSVWALVASNSIPAIDTNMQKRV